jgi:hypothetical protein
MYAGGRPNEKARAIHRRFVSGPLPRLLPIAAVLDVRGRRSGAIIRVPMVTVRYRGNWYLMLALGTRPHLPVNWRSPVSAFEGIASQYPVFRVT